MSAIPTGAINVVVVQLYNEASPVVQATIHGNGLYEPLDNPNRTINNIFLEATKIERTEIASSIANQVALIVDYREDLTTICLFTLAFDIIYCTLPIFFPSLIALYIIAGVISAYCISTILISNLDYNGSVYLEDEPISLIKGNPYYRPKPLRDKLNDLAQKPQAAGTDFKKLWDQILLEASQNQKRSIIGDVACCYDISDCAVRVVCSRVLSGNYLHDDSILQDLNDCSHITDSSFIELKAKILSEIAQKGLPVVPEPVMIPEVPIPFFVDKFSQLAEKAECTPAMKCLLDMLNKWHDEAQKDAK